MSRLEVIRPRERVTAVSYELFFASLEVPGAGYGFDCTAEGTLIDDACRTAAERAEQVAEIVAAGQHAAPVVNRRQRSWIEYALARCTCGAELELADPLDNECEACGRWFNGCGQQVLDPDSELGREMRREDDRYADEPGVY